MTWYAAHIIIYMKFKDGIQDSYSFYENIVLIEASSEEEAFEKARVRAKDDEGDDDESFTCEGRPAIRVFGGTRKLIKCDDPHLRPRSGTEVTYSEMMVKNEEDFLKLTNGDPVNVVYEM